MSRITSVITNDGSTHNVSHLNLDTNTLAEIVRRGAAAVAKVLGVNLYNAKDAPFCLGSKVYRDADVAKQNASTRKGNYFSSFEVKYNASARTMELVDGNEGGAMYTRFALFNGTSFEKPSYASLSAAQSARGYGNTSKLIVEIGVRGTEAVSVRVVA